MPIDGETGLTWTRAGVRPGAVIRCGDSAPIQMWTFDDIPGPYKIGWWDPKIGWTTAGGLVQAIPDQYGGYAQAQASGALQPEVAEIDGYPAALWPSALNERHLAPAGTFSPAYILGVMQYQDGAQATFVDAPTLFGLQGAASVRIAGDPGRSTLLAQAWASQGAKNASGVMSATVLPMPKCMIEFHAAPLALPYAWGIGSPNNSITGRGWQGPVFEALFLGVDPTLDPELHAKNSGCCDVAQWPRSAYPSGACLRH
ncbi:hypothetical protein ACFSKM_27605 [Ancylobacter dichloromethanicus]